MSFPSSGSALLDDFSGAAGADPKWTIIWQGGFAQLNLDGAGLGVDPNQAVGYAWDYYNPATYGPDCECYVTIASVPVAEAFRLFLRTVNSGANKPNGYSVNVAATTGVWTLVRWDANVQNTLYTGPTQLLAAGDQVGVRMVGTVLSAWYKPSGGAWAQMCSYDTAPDATKYSAAGYFAIEFGFKNTKIDSFSGGTYSAGSLTLLSGRIGTGAALRGGTLKGVLARILSGRVGSVTAVRGGALRGITAHLRSGRIATGAALRGGTLKGLVARLASGRVATAAAVRGGHPRGVLARIASGRIGPLAAVRGGALVPSAFHLLSGRIASTARVLGGLLGYGSQPRLVQLELSAALANDITLAAVASNELTLAATAAYTLDLGAAIQ